MTHRKLIALICILGTLACVLLSGIEFNFSPFERDTTAYLFQAKLFAQGKVCAPAPPEFGFSSSPHINILNGKWFAKYPFGNSLMLALGVRLHAPWLIPALATGWMLFFLYRMVRTAYGEPVAILTAFLALISPATIGMGATWFSESVSRFYLALYLAALFPILRKAEMASGMAAEEYRNTRTDPKIARNPPLTPPRRGTNCFSISGGRSPPWRGLGVGLTESAFILAPFSDPRALWLAGVAGFALGYAFNTRPMTAVAFGLAGAGLTLYTLVRASGRRMLLRPLAAFIAPFALMVGLSLAWNAYFTGHPLKATHTALQPADRLGFGKRSEGYEPDLAKARLFTPSIALAKMWRHVLPCIGYNTLGWGYYHPNLFRYSRLYAHGAEAGLFLRDPTAGKKIGLAVRGLESGSGQIRFSDTDERTGEETETHPTGFYCSNGRAAVDLRLVRDGAHVTGWFSMDNGGSWLPAGTATVASAEALDVGIRAEVAKDAGILRVDDLSFRVRSASVPTNGAALRSDDFRSGVGLLWRWIGKAYRADASGLHVIAGRTAGWRAADRGKVELCQTASETAFDVETRFAADWGKQERWLALRRIPLAFPAALALLPLFHRSRNRYDVFFLACVLSTMALYFPFYFSGTTSGSDALSARYYNEAIVLAALPLIARGLWIAHSWVRSLPSRIPFRLWVAGLTILGLNTLQTHLRNSGAGQVRGGIYRELPELVRRENVHHAVVFIPVSRDAPLGEYPFRPLDEADVVYFKLGPNPEWRLNSIDWRAVYKRYFQGRRAYRYHIGHLTPLMP